MRRAALYLHRLNEGHDHGIHRYCHELAAALGALPAPRWQADLWTGKERRGVPLHTDVRVLPVPRRPLHAAWLYAAFPPIDRFVGRPDVVHQLSPSFPLPSRAPLLVTIHDALPAQRPDWYSPREHLGFARAMRHAADHASAVIVPTHVVRQDVLEHTRIAAARIHVIPEGVTPRLQGPADARVTREVAARYGVEPGGYVVALGEIRARKNLGVLFRAVMEMAQPPHVLVVGAPGPGSEETLALPAALGVEHLVTRTGRLPDHEVAALLDGALALVHPALYEGFGLPPLEAMARGVPVVASSAGSLPEVVAGAGLFADPDEPAAWAAQLGQLRADQDLAASLRAAGAGRAAELTWRGAAEATADLYDAVV